MDKNRDKVSLICFPYAGGSRYSYGVFESVAPRKFNILPLELPGRGDRIGEPLLTEINSMVDDLFRQIRSRIDEPYIIYGHSMGAILAYLVIKKISQYNLPLPRHLFISGCEGPSAVKHKKQKLRSHLPPDEFIEELKGLGGVPEDILKDESFIRFFEPILRADLKAIEGYEHRESIPFNIPVAVLYGSEEDLTFEDVYAWQEESITEVEVIKFSGNHFFIFKHKKEIMDIIERMVGQTVAK